MVGEVWGTDGPDDSPFDHAIDAGWINPEDLSRAMLDVMNERDRQWNEEGFAPQHDDSYVVFQLGKAAAAYLGHAVCNDRTRREHEIRGYPPGIWPWARNWWKPKDRRRDLVRAAALIVAEIERLDRLTKREAAAQKEIST